MLVAMMMMMTMAMAAPNPRTIDAPRKAYAACIKGFETKSLAAKMDPAAYETAVKGVCTGEAAALAKALTDYDVAMGRKRAEATEYAAGDVADYVLTSQERFRVLITPAKAN